MQEIGFTQHDLWAMTMMQINALCLDDEGKEKLKQQYHAMYEKILHLIPQAARGIV